MTTCPRNFTCAFPRGASQTNLYASSAISFCLVSDLPCDRPLARNTSLPTRQPHLAVERVRATHTCTHRRLFIAVTKSRRHRSCRESTERAALRSCNYSSSRESKQTPESGSRRGAIFHSPSARRHACARFEPCGKPRPGSPGPGGQAASEVFRCEVCAYGTRYDVPPCPPGREENVARCDAVRCDATRCTMP